MQQIKLFKSIESDLPALEREVNDWIAKTSARVISITGNVAPQSTRAAEPNTSGTIKPGYPPSDVLLIVLYESDTL